MANRTVKEARNIHGTNPQYLVEKIIRSRIYDSKYWKEQCFALTAELLVDKAMELRFVGGVYGGNIKPTQFLCLSLKMLQIQPERDIVIEFIKNEEFKYVRALGAFYLRLTGSSLDCYKYLEPLYNDNRKLRRQSRTGHFEIVYMDEFIDELLRNDRVCDIILPRIQKRSVLEVNNEIEPRISVLDEELDDVADLNDRSGKSGDDLAGGGRKKKKKERSGSKDREKRIKKADDEYYEKQRERVREREQREREREREENERGRFRRLRDWDRDKESGRRRYERGLDDDIRFDPYPNDDDVRYERAREDIYDPLSPSYDVSERDRKRNKRRY